MDPDIEQLFLYLPACPVCSCSCAFIAHINCPLFSCRIWSYCLRRLCVWVKAILHKIPRQRANVHKANKKPCCTSQSDCHGCREMLHHFTTQTGWLDRISHPRRGGMRSWSPASPQLLNVLNTVTLCVSFLSLTLQRAGRYLANPECFASTNCTERASSQPSSDSASLSVQRRGFVSSAFLLHANSSFCFLFVLHVLIWK